MAGRLLEGIAGLIASAAGDKSLFVDDELRQAVRSSLLHSLPLERLRGFLVDDGEDDRAERDHDKSNET